jgi:aldehyde:ferredoxin oxidoreductase
MENEVLDFFCETDEEYVNPLLGERRRAEKEPLYALADEFFCMRGWDPATGRPLPETLRALGLSHIASTAPAGE